MEFENVEMPEVNRSLYKFYREKENNRVIREAYGIQRVADLLFQWFFLLLLLSLFFVSIF